MGRHREETQRVEEKRERERGRANAAGAATRRTRRFQERLALTRKSKIVKSNFVETFAILSLSLSLPFLCPFRAVSLSPSSPLWRFRCRRFTHYRQRSRPRGGDQNFSPPFLFAIDRFSANSLLLPFDYVSFPRSASLPFPFFFFNFCSGSRRFTTRFRLAVR